jgi:putative PIN family toxin of toxin-antitoxin system
MKSVLYAMAVRKIRIILDTNWYVSATINKKSRRTLYELITNKNVVIIFSSELMNEYNHVIKRDKFKKVIKPQQANRFINLVLPNLENIEIKADLSGSRDLSDNFLLSLSLDGKADYLVTGDMDLLILKSSGSTKIITLIDFLAIISPQTQ